MAKKRNNREHRFQVKFVNWLRAENIFVFSVPNGANVDMISAVNLKREGLTPGVSDLIVLRPGGKTFFLELKTESGSPNKEQKLFRAGVERLGFEYMIIRPGIDFKEILRRLEGNEGTDRGNQS